MAPFWRNIEKRLRLDIVLGLRAKAIADQYDIVMAGSEKVGFPLAMMHLNRPLVVIAHNIGQPLKKKLGRLIGVPRRWTRIGYTTNHDKEWMSSYYKIPMNRFFPYLSILLTPFLPQHPKPDGTIMSIGVTKRDYKSLVAALEALPGYQTEIYATSRYGDLWEGPKQTGLPEWIRFNSEESPPEKIAERYKQAKFVVLPLLKSPHMSAGVTAALETLAAGKALIATDTPGVRDLVQDGVTGLLVPPGDVEALKSAISKLWNNPGLAFQMGLKGRRLAETCFDASRVTLNVKEMLAELHSEGQLGERL